MTAASTTAPTPAKAADILGVYETEVADVEKSDAGPVAVTTDGQRYLLTGAKRGEFTWLRPPAPPSAKK